MYLLRLSLPLLCSPQTSTVSEVHDDVSDEVSGSPAERSGVPTRDLGPLARTTVGTAGTGAGGKVDQSKTGKIGYRKKSPEVRSPGQKAGKFAWDIGFERRSGTGRVDHRQTGKKSMLVSLYRIAQSGREKLKYRILNAGAGGAVRGGKTPLTDRQLWQLCP